MSEMFYKATSFNRPLNNWDVSSVTDMSDMFYDTKSFNQWLEKWEDVLEDDEMFECSAQDPLPKWYKKKP